MGDFCELKVGQFYRWGDTDLIVRPTMSPTLDVVPYSEFYGEYYFYGIEMGSSIEEKFSAHGQWEDL